MTTALSLLHRKIINSIGSYEERPSEEKIRKTSSCFPLNIYFPLVVCLKLLLACSSFLLTYDSLLLAATFEVQLSTPGHCTILLEECKQIFKPQNTSWKYADLTTNQFLTAAINSCLNVVVRSPTPFGSG